MNILLINPPVYTPTVIPYSLVMLKAKLNSKIKDRVIAIDLNSKYHYMQFQDIYHRKEVEIFNCCETYYKILDEFIKKTRSSYPQISKDVIAGIKPFGYEKILNLILKENPDVVGISLTYNSQIFYAKALIDGLKEKGIKIVFGGPADYSKIIEGTTILPSAEFFVEYLVNNGATRRKTKQKIKLDYSNFNKKEYFSPELVYSFRTSRSCPYQRCTFCTHHSNKKYELMDLNLIKETIINNDIKKVCFIDDDIPPHRLKELAAMLKSLKVKWWCQLRPIKQLVDLLPSLYDTGLTSVAWGVESGSQRVLDQMQKGTKVEDVENVLAAAHKLGIKNMVYVLFGLPTETEAEFIQTVEFLERNKDNIDIVSHSIFGLQQGSKIYYAPEKFGVNEIKLGKRTLLGDKVSYTPSSGLTNEQVKQLKKKYLQRINAINSLQKVIVISKEQVLNYQN